MKRFLLMLALVGAVTDSFAQNNAVDKPSASKEMEALELAAGLVKYGYENYSASSLVEAAAIMLNTETQIAGEGIEYIQGEGDSDGKTEKLFSVERILTDAKEFAEGDEFLIKKINNLQQINSGTSRGRLGGPSETHECVLKYSTDSYRITFKGGQTAEILVSGDGDTDLDLYVYDENGNQIDFDIDTSDTMYCSWTPKWTGTFIVKIKNLGSVCNYYTMWTN